MWSGTWLFLALYLPSLVAGFRAHGLHVDGASLGLPFAFQEERIGEDKNTTSFIAAESALFTP